MGSVLQRTHKIVAIGDPVLLFVGVSYMSMITNQVFLWMVPTPELSWRNARELKKVWRQNISQYDQVFCAVRYDDTRAQHWATFFGFLPVWTYDEENALWLLSPQQ
jgi:hypothetical protein